ncbi:MAG: Gfo/Idh/MocA family oxidoreductase [Clostridia bacterium]|nr:Gfo/Idh/MocA family oxidoreductase [Clostridia bacterium]
MKHSVRWGILATGTIAKNFAETAARMDDIHIAAVASRSLDKANAFADAYGIANRHASIQALADDPQVDIVYVATPHSCHFDDMKALIAGGKHILCEKSFTTDAAQAREIFALAKEKGVFVMEAFWTKFIPVYRHLSKLLADGAIGEIRAVTATYGYTTARQARKFDAQLAGGTLLDIGVYAIGFACMALGYEFDVVKSTLVMNPEGTDATDAILLRRGNAVAQLTCAIGSFIPTFAAIYGTLGRIEIPEFKNPERITLYADGKEPLVFCEPFEVNGFEYEIREAQHCVLEGKTHSSVMTAAQTIAVMGIMDEVRRQNDLVFPFEK